MEDKLIKALGKAHLALTELYNAYESVADDNSQSMEVQQYYLDRAFEIAQTIMDVDNELMKLKEEEL